MQSQIIIQKQVPPAKERGSGCKNIYAAFSRTVFDFLLDMFILRNQRDSASYFYRLVLLPQECFGRREIRNKFCVFSSECPLGLKGRNKVWWFVIRTLGSHKETGLRNQIVRNGRGMKNAQQMLPAQKRKPREEGTTSNTNWFRTMAACMETGERALFPSDSALRTSFHDLKLIIVDTQRHLA